MQRLAGEGFVVADAGFAHEGEVRSEARNERVAAHFENAGQARHFFYGAYIKRFGNEGGFFEKVLSESQEGRGGVRLEMKVAISARLGKQKSAVGCVSVL